MGGGENSSANGGAEGRSSVQRFEEEHSHSANPPENEGDRIEDSPEPGRKVIPAKDRMQRGEK